MTRRRAIRATLRRLQTSTPKRWRLSRPASSRFTATPRSASRKITSRTRSRAWYQGAMASSAADTGQRARERPRRATTRLAERLRAHPELVATVEPGAPLGRRERSPRPLVHGPDPRLVGHDRRAPVRKARDRDRGDRLAAPVDPRHGGLHLEPALPAPDRAVLRCPLAAVGLQGVPRPERRRHGERGVPRVPARQTRPLAPVGVRRGGAVGERAVDGPRRLSHVRGGRVPRLPLGPARDAARDRLAGRAQRPAGGRGARPRLPRASPVRGARARAAARGARLRDRPRARAGRGSVVAEGPHGHPGGGRPAPGALCPLRRRRRRRDRGGDLGLGRRPPRRVLGHARGRLAAPARHMAVGGTPHRHDRDRSRLRAARARRRMDAGRRSTAPAPTGSARSRRSSCSRSSC